MDDLLEGGRSWVDRSRVDGDGDTQTAVGKPYKDAEITADYVVFSFLFVYF